jgi:hypothetical protein
MKLKSNIKQTQMTLDQSLIVKVVLQETPIMIINGF